MTNNNTLGRIEYVINNIFWSLVAMLWFKGLIFIRLDGCSVAYSKRVLWILVAVMVALGVVVTFKHRRNNVSVAVNVLFPYEIYSVISYTSYLEKRIGIILSLTCAAVLFYFSLVMFRRIKTKKLGRFAVIIKRLGHALLGARTLSAVCLCALILPIGINSLMGKEMYRVSESSEDGPMVYTSISENIEEVKQLDPEIWDTLSIKERLEVLQVVKNIEINYLGINHDVYLTADDPGETTLACYVPREHKIIMSAEHVKNSTSKQVLHSLLHECYHVYTYQMVDLYREVPDEYKKMQMFRNVQTYEKEYADYVDGDKDYIGYADQLCEEHSEMYADEMAEEYFRIIEQHKEN